MSSHQSKSKPRLDQSAEAPSTIVAQSRSARDNLAKAIFEAEVPEQYIRTLPAQSVYLTIKQNGLLSSADLMEIATLDQIRLCIDFDLWHGDQLAEDQLWDWLSLTDQNNDLSLLQKILKCIDLKIVSVLLSRYTEVVTLDEPSEEPPGPGYYTPDKGLTWIRILLEDGTRHFLLARLLALIFESSIELFYQLLAIPGVSTASLLEEEAYQDRVRRLQSEGIPDPELANKLHRPLSIEDLKKRLNHSTRPTVEDIQPVFGLMPSDHSTLEPLGSLFGQLENREEVYEEITFIVNAALVHYHVDFDGFDEVRELGAKVRGAINIGLIVAHDKLALTERELYDRLGLQDLYRCGLSLLSSLRKSALAVPEGVAAKVSSLEQATLEHLQLPFPDLIEQNSITSTDGGSSSRTRLRPFETVEDLDTAHNFVRALVGNATT